MLFKLLDQINNVTTVCPPVSKIIICFGHYQLIYEKMIQSIKRQFPNSTSQMFNHYPEAQLQSKEFWKVPSGTQMILIIDDLCQEIKPSFEKILRGTCHHARVTLFYLSQDHSSEPKVVKNALKSVGYYILTKSGHGTLLQDLNRKIQLYKPRFLYYAMQEAMKDSEYPYIILDLNVSCAPENIVRTGLFLDSENARIFRSV